MNSIRVSFPKLLLSNAVALGLLHAGYVQADEYRLEEVLVTAEKLAPKSVMDTAFSVSAVSGEELEKQGTW